MSKLKVGIDINEVLRARWLQFDRYYAQEFGEDNLDDQPQYVYDFWKNYHWEEVQKSCYELLVYARREILKILGQPAICPEDPGWIRQMAAHLLPP